MMLVSIFELTILNSGSAVELLVNLCYHAAKANHLQPFPHGVGYVDKEGKFTGFSGDVVNSVKCKVASNLGHDSRSCAFNFRHVAFYCFFG